MTWDRAFAFPWKSGQSGLPIVTRNQNGKKAPEGSMAVSLSGEMVLILHMLV